METTELGSTGIAVSRLSFGGCPMGGHGWGDVSRDDFVAAIRTALDAGLNFFDTADTYGLGEGERTLGEAVAGRRHEAVIATKFGVRVENGRTFYDNSPAWAKAALEASLTRLKTDYVDIFQVHYRDDQTPFDEMVSALFELQDEGKIRHIGLSNIGTSDLNEISAYPGRFATFQNEFSLANRSHEQDIVLLSQETAMTPLTWGSLGQGILSGKYDKTSAFGAQDRRSREVYVNFHGEKLEQNLRIVEVLQQIADELDKSVSAVAIRWILDHLPNSVAIVGIKNDQQLQANLSALDWRLPPEAMTALDHVSREQENPA